MADRRPSFHWRSAAIALAVCSLSFAALLAATPKAAATTYVSGPISVDTTWGAGDTVYVVTGHVTVRSGVSLTILEGTTVYFDPGMGLFVEGFLWADGAPGKEISYLPNATFVLNPWLGVQFNASSFGSVTWGIFDRADRAVTAFDSSPTIQFNTVRSATIGFALQRSNAFLADNTILRATWVGIVVLESSATVLRNAINATQIGIQVQTLGSPNLGENTVTNITGALAIGIYVSDGSTASLWDNTVRGVLGGRGANGLALGENGGAGGAAFGVLISLAPSATLYGNTVESVYGGRGGDGRENPSGTGGSGGPGGSGAGIVVWNTPTVDLSWNTVRSVYGGRGGNGGGGPTTTNGGDGAEGGDAAGIYAVSASSGLILQGNSIDTLGGGIGGSGAGGTNPGTDGDGAIGGDAVGMSTVSDLDAQVSGNLLQNLRGGLGGNSSATGTGRGAAGGGGESMGIFNLAPAGPNTYFHQNILLQLRAGDGGRAATGGYGGNATGLLTLAADDGWFNGTTATGNWIQSVTGGDGGIGGRSGGNGGLANGVSIVLSSFYMGGNYLSSFLAGDGGQALDNSDGGRGGDATGLAAGLTPSGWSAGDDINTVTRGLPGQGPPARSSYGTGVYLGGNASLHARLTLDNVTLQGIGDRDLWVANYGDGTTINTPFSTAKLAIDPAGNLTVRNYLAVEVYWSDGFTPVGGAQIRVDDNGARVWDVTTQTGFEPWLLVTDRVYINSIVPTDNTTDVSVSFGGYVFGNNPRSVDMSSGRTETFVMIDADAPNSAADPLPMYTNSWSFFVGYTADDGTGVGLQDISLYYRFDNSGPWILYATQPAGPIGTFSFTASADGVYEFATVATDLNGNVEPGPNANDTWTSVDTVRPGSHVEPMPIWRNTRTFLVSWEPDLGVTDIATYEVEYNSGLGWTTWLFGTTLTSAMFTAPSDGLYQFRSKATDLAGNVEIVPATNDTWTNIDTFAPFTSTTPLPVWQTTTSFLVQWVPEADDVASYRIQVRDNGGSWTDWIPSTTSLSATYTGAQDAHTYEFRSLGTDYAGNVQPTPSGNQSWTKVDLTAPDSAVNALPQYHTTLMFTITWGPVSGTTDIATYTLEAKDNGGAWTPVPGSINTAAVSTSFVGADGHTYEFRTVARDRAGNAEAAPSQNDTWTVVDTSRPSVITAAPRGSGASTSPTITVTFSEPMNRASAEQAFTITPDMNGNFSWSSDSRVMTFRPERPLAGGTDYVVGIDSSARDVAGNTMSAPYTFQFTTQASLTTGFDFTWIIAILIAAAVGGVGLFLFMRQRAAASAKAAPAPAVKPSDEIAVIDDVFLLYNDGLLIKHETRRLKPDVDTDILSGMLTAVQQFVKDSFRTEEGELDEMTFGQMHILIGRGKWVILAAMVSGDGTESFTRQIKSAIKDMETHHWDQLESWNGDMSIAKTLSPYVKKLIRGEYTIA